MTTHISLDLETWGTRPGCDIRSIGATVFFPGSNIGDGVPDGTIDGIEQAFYIACDNPCKYPHGSDEYPDLIRKYPLHRDPRTVQWWSEQSDEGQAAFTDPVDLREALERFSEWLYRVNDNNALDERLRIWSHGSHFDPPILAAAYEAIGLPVPWHYRAPRDTRTLFDAAGIDDHSMWLKQHPGPLGVPHHALDDAICQARAVCAAWSRLRVVGNRATGDTV